MRFHADPEQIHATARRISGWADDLGNDVEAVLGQVKSVLQDGWRGGAADTHESAWRDWEDGARRIVTALREDAELLHGVTNLFVEADQR